MNCLKRFIPYIIIVISFVVIAYAYTPYVLKGEIVNQSDISAWRGMANEIITHNEAHPEDPALWTGSMFSGMPATQISVDYKGDITTPIYNALFWGERPPSYLIISLLGGFLLFLAFGINPYLAAVGAIAITFCSYNMQIIQVGHNTKMVAIAFMPWVMAGLVYAYRKKNLLGATLFGLVLSFQIKANHPQITYYFLLAMVALWLSEGIFAFKEKTLKDFAKRTAVLAAAGIIGVGSNLSPLWQTMQHSKETIRGGSELVAEDAESGNDGLDLEYATAWSYGRAESLNMFVPDFMGGASTDTFAADGPVAESLREYGLEQMAQYMPRYRGAQPYTAGPTYLGAATIFLAIMALWLLPARQRWWIVGASVFTLLMSWGNNLMWLTELLFDYLPGYNKFRTLSMALVVVQWTVPLLAALGIARVVAEDADTARIKKALRWATGICVGVLLVMIVGGRSLGDYGMQEGGESLSAQLHEMLSQQGGEEYIRQGVHEQIAWATASAMADERVDAMQADAWRSLLFVVLAAVAVAGYATRKVIKSAPVLCCVLAVVVAADLINVDTRYLNHDSFVDAYTAKITPTEADRLIMEDKDPAYRVLNLTVSPFNDATTSYFHRSVGGYHGAKLSRYQDMIDHHLSYLREGVLDMLNVRYIIDQPTAEGVFVRETANGAAWMVESVVRASSPQEEIEAVGRIDTKREAVMTDEYLPENFHLAKGEVTLEEYRPNYLRYTSRAEGDALVVFSEIFTKQGWTVTIDGAEARPLRADYILRAVEVPAGEHTIEWRYRAPNWALVEGIAMACSVVVLAGFLLTLIYLIRNARRQEDKA